jgi:hypothetical protein
MVAFDSIVIFIVLISVFSVIMLDRVSAIAFFLGAPDSPEGRGSHFGTRATGYPLEY